ncbi:beta-lactamase family protein [Rossellomorea vietnamensis]|uniref:Beta-lactamase family protein n=1 Tax=Rossellomorea vietnamensis TaxID=218284 RepID=A0A5D4MHT6_9BACI|nr:serine hydrolase domain-containing protein [Rossellomorea vietnamensis]TYS01313.1 beta-lactamase family protein [Rossellomorea vietnamensis]
MIFTNLNIQERMEHYKVNGLSISWIENGQLQGVKNYGILEGKKDRKVKDTSIFSACSISKFITSMTALKLIDEGLLDLDQNVNDRLVSWKVPDNKFINSHKVTLRDLLSHHSGIQDPEGSFSELAAEIGIPSMVELLKGKTTYCKDPIELKSKPGSEFHYSDAGFCVIQQLIEDVTKKPFEQVVKELLLEPLGMKDSLFLTNLRNIDHEEFSCGHDYKGDVVDERYPIYPYPAASGLWTTSTDLAVLVIELIDALKGKSKIGISESLAREMITPQKGKSWAGLGVFLDSKEGEVEITSMGWGIGFQSMLAVYPGLEKGVVIMTNAELGVHQMKGIIGEIYNSI